MSTEEYITDKVSVPLKSPYGGLSATPRDQSFHTTDNTNKNFKGQQKDEAVHCFTRKHWIVLLPHFIGSIIFIMGIAWFLLTIPFSNLTGVVSGTTYRTVSLFCLFLLTYAFHRFFLRVFNYYLQTLIITNFRIVQLDQTLYFKRQRDSVDLSDIQDIVVNQQGIIKTLLNYGEVVISLSSVHSSRRITCIPNPEYYFRKINKTKQEYVILRGGK